MGKIEFLLVFIGPVVLVTWLIHTFLPSSQTRWWGKSLWPSAIRERRREREARARG
jgi:hypothetical protein